MKEERRRDYNDFSLRMSSSLSKRWVCVLLKTYLGFFSLNGLLNTFVGNKDIYSMGEGKKVTLKNPPSREFRGYLARRPYPRDTRKILQAGMTFSRVSFPRAFREIHLFFNSCSILHQINTKYNTIKSHKIRGTKLKQLQHFLSWNKANVKHSCKSQIYKREAQPLSG